MNPILASSTVLFTILFSLVFGIACGYAVISAILHAFAHRQVESQATTNCGDCHHGIQPLSLYFSASFPLCRKR